MQRVHAGNQLCRSKRLGDIVVGAKHQRAHLVHLLTFCREHDDADGGRTLANLLADGKAVLAGHHDVQQADVKIAVVFVEHPQCFVAVGHIDHLIAGAAQVDDHKIADDVFVFRNQNSFHSKTFLSSQ